MRSQWRLSVLALAAFLGLALSQSVFAASGVSVAPDDYVPPPDSVTTTPASSSTPSSGSSTTPSSATTPSSSTAPSSSTGAATSSPTNPNDGTGASNNTTTPSSVDSSSQTQTPSNAPSTPPPAQQNPASNTSNPAQTQTQTQPTQTQTQTPSSPSSTYSSTAPTQVTNPGTMNAGQSVSISNGDGVANQSTTAAATSRIQSLAQTLTQQSACWSCQIYGVAFTSLRTMVDQVFQYFVGGTGGALALAITLLALALLIKILPIAMGISSPEATKGLGMFFVRVTFVGAVFLGSGAVSTSGSFISDWFVDGPLALGTMLGTELGDLTAQAIGTDGGNPFGSNLGQMQAGTMPSNDPTTVGLTDTGGNPNDDGSAAPTQSTTGTGAIDLGTQHVTAAKAMLFVAHKFGVCVLIIGLWLAFTGATQAVANPVSFIMLAFAGLSMATSAFMFTLTFGIRYVDALIRMMVLSALSPILAFMWIFDTTRPMAMKAFKMTMALAMVFALSGIVISVAIFIIGVAFQQALNGQSGGSTGTAISTASLSNVLSQVQGGTMSFMISTNGSNNPELSYFAYFWLVAGSMAGLGLASSSFDLVAKLLGISHEGADMGIGKEVEGEMRGGFQRLRGMGVGIFGFGKM